MFPAMSKLVTADQGLFNRSHYLQGEDLWKAMERVWNNYSLRNLYVHHSQMATTVVEVKGGDDLVKKQHELYIAVSEK